LIHVLFAQKKDFTAALTQENSSKQQVPINNEHLPNGSRAMKTNKHFINILEPSAQFQLIFNEAIVNLLSDYHLGNIGSTD
jgi:hypothetical protein